MWESSLMELAQRVSEDLQRISLLIDDPLQRIEHLIAQHLTLSSSLLLLMEDFAILYRQPV